MDSKIRPSEVYITATIINNAKSEENYTIEEEIENNQQWGEDFVPQSFFT
jgi:hypothetical protein